VNTNTIGAGFMNSLWINCLSLSFVSYSPTLRVTLASKPIYKLIVTIVKIVSVIYLLKCYRNVEVKE